jgi:hypothetical protein
VPAPLFQRAADAGRRKDALDALAIVRLLPELERQCFEGACTPPATSQRIQHTWNRRHLRACLRSVAQGFSRRTRTYAQHACGAAGTLRFLASFARPNVAGKTLMDARALATVFAPNFVRALTIEAEHQNAAAICAFVELLIVHYADAAE